MEVAALSLGMGVAIEIAGWTHYLRVTVGHGFPNYPTEVHDDRWGSPESGLP